MATERVEEKKTPGEEPIQVQTDPSPQTFSEDDCEKHGANRESNPMPDLKRKLKSRHLQMIAIGALSTFCDFSTRYTDSSQAERLEPAFSSAAAVQLRMLAQSAL